MNEYHSRFRMYKFGISISVTGKKRKKRIILSMPKN
jgi:hypothetical protein